MSCAHLGFTARDVMVCDESGCVLAVQQDSQSATREWLAGWMLACSRMGDARWLAGMCGCVCEARVCACMPAHRDAARADVVWLSRTPHALPPSGAV
jgi:hypothetical protein